MALIIRFITVITGIHDIYVLNVSLHQMDSEWLRIACQLNSLYEKSNVLFSLSLGFILFNKGFLKTFFLNINIYLATVS